MIARRTAPVLALVVFAVLLCVAGAAGAGEPSSVSENPRSSTQTLERRLDRIERMIRRMEPMAKRWKRWTKCIVKVPVSEYGDPDHRFGFRYDERDGSGLDHRPAIAMDRRKARRPNLVMFEFSDRRRCRGLGEQTTQPGTPGSPGTADPAKLSSASARPQSRSLSALERRFAGLERREARLERMSEQFDEWESCLSWIPVTEYGDPEGRYGYEYRDREGARGYRPALAIDRSGWDDPDYMFLGGELSRMQLRQRGGDETDSPSAPPEVDLRQCNDEPGESVDRPIASYGPEPVARDTAAGDRLEDLHQELDSFFEDVEDLGEPVEEFETFDQCMHLIGVAQSGDRAGKSGYVYGNGRLRPALAMDMRGPKDPQHELLAFPGEEPPSIECNEDAGGLFTN